MRFDFLTKQEFSNFFSQLTVIHPCFDVGSHNPRSLTQFDEIYLILVRDCLTAVLTFLNFIN